MFAILTFAFLLHNAFYVTAQSVSFNVTDAEVRFGPIRLCGANQHFNFYCNNPCPVTCGNYYLSNKFCSIYRCVPRCVCNSGYILSKTLNKCVRPAQCPPAEVVCPKYQEYFPGLFIRLLCPPIISTFSIATLSKAITIADQLISVIRYCVIDLTPGCRCIRGYVKHAITGNCYNPDIIVSCIDQNAYYDPCGGYCTYPSCFNKFGVCWKLDECRPACICFRGLIYNERLRRCTSPAECSQIVGPWYNPEIFRRI